LIEYNSLLKLSWRGKPRQFCFYLNSSLKKERRSKMEKNILETALPIFLTGKLVVLRPLHKETDLESYWRWINDSSITRYLTTYLPMTYQQEEEWFDKLGSRQNDISFAIDTVKERKLIGAMRLFDINWKNRTATTGAFIGDKDYWGKGYGTDAKLILLEYAFNTLNLRKINSSVMVYNERSLRYCLRCGYKEEGRLISQVYRFGKYWDEILLAVFKEDWEKIWDLYQETGSIR